MQLISKSSEGNLNSVIKRFHNTIHVNTKLVVVSMAEMLLMRCAKFDVCCQTKNKDALRMIR